MHLEEATLAAATTNTGEHMRLYSSSRRWTHAIPLLALAAMAMPAFAQERFSTIRGTVKDATGAVVPAVTVTLVNSETSRGTTTETGDTGVFIARQLEPGRYSVFFEKQGFNKHEIKDVQLSLGREAIVDAAL